MRRFEHLVRFAESCPLQEGLGELREEMGALGDPSGCELERASVEDLRPRDIEAERPVTGERQVAPCGVGKTVGFLLELPPGGDREARGPRCSGRRRTRVVLEPHPGRRFDPGGRADVPLGL